MTRSLMAKGTSEGPKVNGAEEVTSAHRSDLLDFSKVFFNLPKKQIPSLFVTSPYEALPFWPCKMAKLRC